MLKLKRILALLLIVTFFSAAFANALALASGEKAASFEDHDLESASVQRDETIYYTRCNCKRYK